MAGHIADRCTVARLTGSGPVHAGPCRLRFIGLSAGAEGATAVVRDGASRDGATLIAMVAAPNGTAGWRAPDGSIDCLAGLHAVLTGDAAFMSVEYVVPERGTPA